MVSYSWVVRFNWNGAACWPSLSYVLEDASGRSSYEWWCRDYAPGADPGSLQGRREAVRKFWCPCEPFSQVSSVVVEAVTQLSPTVKGFSMLVENENLSFKAGQWYMFSTLVNVRIIPFVRVDMHIPSVDTVGGYSITSAPHLLREKRLFTLAIQHSSHPPTLWMTSQCRVGDTLSVRVGGDFVYDPAPSESRDSRLQSCDLCLIAGGMGINPLMSILLHHTRLVELGQITGRVKLLYSARTVADLLFKVSMMTKICLYRGVMIRLRLYIIATGGD